jgi:hypothetical protein
MRDDRDSGYAVISDPTKYMSQDQYSDLLNEDMYQTERKKSKSRRRKSFKTRSIRIQKAKSRLARYSGIDTDSTNDEESSTSYTQRKRDRREVYPSSSSDRSGNRLVRNSSGSENSETPDELDNRISRAIERHLERRQVMNPEPTPNQIHSEYLSQEMDGYVNDDLRHRMADMNTLGVSSTAGFDFETQDRRRLEMEHWRMKLELEQKQMLSTCSDYISIGAAAVEGICKATKLSFINTSNLSADMNKAIEDGRFDAFVQQYTNTSGGEFMKNPTCNFVSTFISVLLKTHIRNQTGTDGVSGKTSTPERPGQSLFSQKKNIANFTAVATQVPLDSVSPPITKLDEDSKETSSTEDKCDADSRSTVPANSVIPVGSRVPVGETTPDTILDPKFGYCRKPFIPVKDGSIGDLDNTLNSIQPIITQIQKKMTNLTELDELAEQVEKTQPVPLAI